MICQRKITRFVDIEGKMTGVKMIYTLTHQNRFLQLGFTGLEIGAKKQLLLLNNRLYLFKGEINNFRD